MQDDLFLCNENIIYTDHLSSIILILEAVE